MNSPSRRTRPGERKSLGREGEELACRYLRSRGFRIIGTNYRRQGGEIDIIARSRNLIVFCEVKTRIGTESPEGYGGIQQHRLVELAERFLAEKSDSLPCTYDVRFDFISVSEGEGGKLEIREHIEDAFRPE
jgi:putative endonuclease